MSYRQLITPIVIEDGRRRFQYMVSSFDDNSFSEDEFFLLDVDETTSCVGEGTLIISDTTEPLVKYGDYWETTSFSKEEPEPGSGGEVYYVGYDDSLVDVLYLDELDDTRELYIGDGTRHNNSGMNKARSSGGIIPSNAKKTVVEIDVPDYSPSTYSRLEYIVDVSTRIGMTKIILACKKFNFDDLLSIEKPYRDGQHKYHQKFSFKIVDPWEICYGDSFEMFRDEYCGETPETNSCGAVVDVEITAVDESGSGYEISGHGLYIPDTRYTSGRNMMLLSEMDSDYMSVNLNNASGGWKTRLVFNSSFEGKLKEYMRETYFMDVESCIPEIVIMDKENIYKIYDLPSSFDECTEFYFSDSVPELRFGDWTEYIDGMYAVSTLRLFSSDGIELMDLKSNIVPIDKTKFSFIVGEKIELEPMAIEIKNETLDIVNKINKTVVNVDRPDDYKSNIIRPVFYRSFPLESIEIHDSVTFTISIDLDSYKTKSDSFSIQIEGMNFTEVGRVPGGVLFKIKGPELPAKEPTGKYYILDEHQELVAEGNYIYV